MPASIYRNVLLVGATGVVGAHILPALLADSTFNVSILSRVNSSAKSPSNAKVIKVDYSNTAALTKLLLDKMSSYLLRVVKLLPVILVLP
jgi:uncharacterized protein YbjT (DUF2867 family)